MKSLSFAALLAAALSLSTIVAPSLARADGGRVAAGVAGGLLGGVLLGSALAQPRYAPAPVYVEEPPVYMERPSRCYMARGEPVWDDYRGVWHRPRVQVCE